MSDDKQYRDEFSRLSEHQVVGELIRRAGPQPRASDYLSDGFKEMAADRWQGIVVKRRRRLWLRRAATVTLAAAAALGFAAVAIRLLAPLTDGPPLATVERVAGELRRVDGGSADSLTAGVALVAGEALGTGRTGRAALRLANGIGLRLDRESRVMLLSQNRLRLERGAVYVDSSGAAESEYLDVETALGIARDIGTVYQLRQEGPEMVVQVREGRVAVRTDTGRHEADAGTQLSLSPDGEVETSAVALHGPGWSWIYEASPSFALEGASLDSYLDWLGRETGWYVRLGLAAADHEALLATRLHGSLEGIEPERTPELVLPVCGLTYRLEDGTLVIEAEETEIRTPA